MKLTHSLKWFHTCLFLALATASLQVAHANVLPGQPAPAFSLKDTAGKSHSLSDYTGKVVVLEWVNPECPFVKKHYDQSGNMPALQKSAASDGVVWLSINSAAAGKQGDYDTDEVAAWQKRVGAMPTAYLRDADGTVGHLYGAKTTPHIYIINKDGMLVYQGGIDNIRSANPQDIAKAENYVTVTLTALKAGESVVKSASEPYGCSVKY